MDSTTGREDADQAPRWLPCATGRPHVFTRAPIQDRPRFCAFASASGLRLSATKRPPHPPRQQPTMTVMQTAYEVPPCPPSARVTRGPETGVVGLRTLHLRRRRRRRFTSAAPTVMRSACRRSAGHASSLVTSRIRSRPARRHQGRASTWDE